ncbi:prephenate dehydrogenase [Halobacteriales archaeon QH_2_65_14]|nr:MAG: prephenate dehydrogenase [Halobacteriales archaeon QH_2_65_14]
MEVLVVGAGTMGRWFGEVLSDGPRTVELTYVDERPSAANEATDHLGGRTLAGDDEAFDVVCIAVPIPVATDAIATYADRATTGIVDVTGTMREPVDAMQRHAPDRERMSLHPLFAPTAEPGNVPVVVDRAGPVTDGVREALERRGNNVFETTPEEHDEMMETVQARAHAAILAFALAGEQVPERFHTPVSADLAGLVETVTGGPGRVYADIQRAFGGAADVAAAASDIASADGEQFERLYERARQDGNASGEDRR